MKDYIQSSYSEPPPTYESLEPLPRYSCDLYREGYLYLKHEKITPDRRHPNRSWYKRYFILRGTALYIYSRKPCSGYEQPKDTWNVADLMAQEAILYYKYPNAFRVYHKKGLCYLLRAEDRLVCLSWIKDFQTSSLLALDIDERPLYSCH